MPSSLEIRIRALDRSSGSLSMRADPYVPAEIGAQHHGNRHRPVRVLPVLQDREERPADGEAGAVEGMDEARPLLAPATRARVHAPRLEIAAGGAARNLAVGALPRQPDLDVEGPPGGEAQVAGEIG